MVTLRNRGAVTVMKWNMKIWYIKTWIATLKSEQSWCLTLELSPLLCTCISAVVWPLLTCLIYNILWHQNKFRAWSWCSVDAPHDKKNKYVLLMGIYNIIIRPTRADDNNAVSFLPLLSQILCILWWSCCGITTIISIFLARWLALVTVLGTVTLS